MFVNVPSTVMADTAHNTESTPVFWTKDIDAFLAKSGRVLCSALIYRVIFKQGSWNRSVYAVFPRVISVLISTAACLDHAGHAYICGYPVNVNAYVVPCLQSGDT